MEQEADEPHLSIAPVAERSASPERPTVHAGDENASPTRSPFQGRGLRRSPPRAISPAASLVAKSPAQPSSSPMRHTPSPKRTTAQTRQSSAKTPPSVFGSGSSSPMRNLSSPIKATPRSPARLKLFHQDPSTGLSTPHVVLTPQGRRLSGVGADRPGLGSPRVAEIFDRRESIGEAAPEFVPSQPANPRRNVAFADPREMEAEIDRERRDEQEKEDSRRILEREVNGSQDDREGTLNLMEMIQGLSPKKNPFRGRKSLHVGSARGLLGKRPAELEDDEDSETDGVKRLKGHQGSPSCRELKKYISEGRRIVHEIETETFEENPPLFREYMTASPEFKVLMDNQFKNVKTHARLLSKAMWYEWRMKLQDGLKEGLLKTAEGMDDDDRLLSKQQELISSILPDMVKRFEALELEHGDLEAVAQELADCDPQDLEDARSELASVDKSIEEKTRKLAELRQELDESVQSVEALTQQKQQYLEEIKEADKIREECRGWSSEEIRKHKAQTDAIEKQHGWAISSIAGTTLTMRYKREIELVFDLATLQQPPKKQQQSNTPIHLHYIADSPRQCPFEKEFVLRHLRAHLQTSPPTSPRHLLSTVSAAWTQAAAVTEHIRRLNLSFPTTTAAVALADGEGEGEPSASAVAVTASVLVAPLQTRVEVVLTLKARSRDGGGGGLEVVAVPEVRVVYGEPFNVGKMTEFLAGRIGRVGGAGGDGDGGKEGGEMGWDEAVLELYQKLLAKGKQKQ
ncbi:hypothetical protein CHGG_00847 [Chaetomium globosum CBS 148.51]|uniref:Spc7 kinetochore protein domain-containing protein n=1 Tax=Chaetomium globosum (strain ATCC 6205 / CBS 148.51 / DSM 1962 / NBRC 6347 / NRRL 1970) TaxID=306901 RepID=Q2HG07_CHAGB|nr:uncharacterized protein CHGG_00847 [Chaetomium globosum CBS 148.51]EAQ92612.1 hypothetical protein CHGG_00847 [Chaetomium globosum CBS 148.51]